jgi:hypothetical protein
MLFVIAPVNKDELGTGTWNLALGLVVADTSDRKTRALLQKVVDWTKSIRKFDGRLLSAGGKSTVVLIVKIRRICTYSTRTISVTPSVNTPSWVPQGSRGEAHLARSEFAIFLSTIHYSGLLLCSSANSTKI